MEHKAIRGLPWTFLAYLGNRAITVATTVALARLLVPRDFGLVAMALVVLAVPNNLSEVGLGSTIVSRQDLDRHGQGTILTLLLVVGLAMALLTVAFAPLAAVFFSQPRLGPIVAVLAATVFITGLTWFYESIMERELEFRSRFLSDLVRTLTYSATALVLAALGLGVWSLVLGQLAAFAAYSVVLLLLTPYRVRPAYSRMAARNVLSTAHGFFVQGGVAFVSENVHYLAVGRAFGAAQLGYYSMAFRFSQLPSYAVAEPVAKVTFPGFARMRYAGEDVTPTYLTTLGLVSVVACPLGVLLSATAKPFVMLLLGTKWVAAIGPLAVLGLWASIRPVHITMGWLLNSLGLPRVVGTIAGIMLIPMLVGLALAAIFGGITTVSWVMLADLALGTLILAGVTQRRTRIKASDHWRTLRPTLIGCAAAWPAARLVADALGHSTELIAFAGSSAAGLAVYAGIVWLIEPETPRLAASYVRGILRRSPDAAPAPS